MKKTILALALSLSLATGSAQAETISFNFSGHWDFVDSRLNSCFVLGNTFSGAVSYNSVTTPTTLGGSVYIAESLFFYTKGSDAEMWTGTVTKPKISMFNGIGGSALDQFLVSFDGRDYSTNFTKVNFFDSFQGFFDAGHFSLTDTRNAVFGGIGLPSLYTMTSSPSPFTGSLFSLSFVQGGGDGLTAFNASGKIDSITPYPSPEPATVLLFATGLTGLVAYRRRRVH